MARTVKGYGVAEVADKNGAHGKALENPDLAVRELGGQRDIHVDVPRPTSTRQPHRFETGALRLSGYEQGGKESTRKAYGDALAALGGARGDVVALDCEVSNSTYSEIFARAHPDRYFEMYIAEKQPSERSSAAPCSTPATRTRRPISSRRWRIGAASRSCGRRGRRRQ